MGLWTVNFRYYGLLSSDIFLSDKTRVVLDEKPDYYHASYVDGCSQVSYLKSA